MKIALLGYSGSGKSTLAAFLGRCYNAPVLHLDAVHHLPGWQERPREEERALVAAFLDAHDAWVIDGNYSKVHYERRLEEADRIIMLLFPRFACLWRVWRRYRRYRGIARPDMAAGCEEKLDGEFIRWVLWAGRTRRARDRYRAVRNRYPEKVVVLRGQRALDRYAREISRNAPLSGKEGPA